MSLASVLQRVAAIDQAIANPVGITGGTAAPAAEPATGAPTFAAALQQAGAPAAMGSLPGTAGTSGAGQRILAAAESQIGQAEQPPGSNESPAIAEYRAATAGAVPGEPWCACFASWASRQAGEPLGAQGEGLGSVSAIWSWAQGAGRAVPNGPGVVPKPGDLIVFGGEHVGIVRGVLPDGSIQTIEGNYENKVALNVRPSGEATGYVSMS
jgi:CHAP domain